MPLFVPSGSPNNYFTNLLLNFRLHSSNVCKLSAVGLGWDRAFGSVNEMGEMDRKMRGWVEIDNAGQIEPMWEAFELFS